MLVSVTCGKFKNSNEIIYCRTDVRKEMLYTVADLSSKTEIKFWYWKRDKCHCTESFSPCMASGFKYHSVEICLMRFQPSTGNDCIIVKWQFAGTYCWYSNTTFNIATYFLNRWFFLCVWIICKYLRRQCRNIEQHRVVASWWGALEPFWM
jgi:hypothetical protein